MYKVALIQCICPHYRVPFFRGLAGEVDLSLFYGRGERTGSWQNAARIEGFKHYKLFSVRLKFILEDFTVRLVWFPALLLKLKRLKPDVVISEGFTNMLNNICTWFFCKAGSVPWVLWDSGRKKDKPMGILRKLTEGLNIFLLKRAKAVLAYGSVARDYFISLGIEPGKIFVAHNTIDTKSCMDDALRLKADPARTRDMRKRYGLAGKKVVLYVGALEKRKGVQNLIKVFRDIQQEIPQAYLVIVGDGSYKKKLAALAGAGRIRNCLFTGRITAGLGAFFSLADIFVLPGRGGLAVNQAMSYGKPVIVGQADGSEADLVKNKINGFLVKDTSELKAALKKLLTDEALSRRMGRAGLEIIGRYTLTNMIRKFVKAIEYVL